MNPETHNHRMAEKVELGHAIDVSGCERTAGGEYILPVFTPQKDYCDLPNRQWIWSIGRELATGQILAAIDQRFYQSAEHECLWLR